MWKFSKNKFKKPFRFQLCFEDIAGINFDSKFNFYIIEVREAHSAPRSLSCSSRSLSVCILQVKIELTKGRKKMVTCIDKKMRRNFRILYYYVHLGVTIRVMKGSCWSFSHNFPEQLAAKEEGISLHFNSYTCILTIVYSREFILFLYITLVFSDQFIGN